MTARFCRNCGQGLEPGTAFCMQCGTAVSPVQVLPAQPVLPTQPAAVTQPAAYTQAPATAKPIRRKPTLLLIIVGVLLLLFGLRIPLLLFVGSQTGGSVTSVRQRIDSTSERMDYNYDIAYSFVVSGKTYTGSYSMNRVYNVSSLPPVGAVVAVKYLPGAAFLNIPVNQGGLGLATILLLGLGVLVLLLGIKGVQIRTKP